MSPSALLLILALAPQEDSEIRPPVRIEDPSRMDAEVVATIGRAILALEDANKDSSEAGREARGKAWSTLGIAYEANTMWSLAENCYEEAVRLLPEKPEWVYRRAVCLQATGDLEQALEAYRNAAGRLGHTAVVQARHGEVALSMGLVEEAAQAWQKAIDSEQKLAGGLAFPESRVGLAQVRVEQEDWAGAEVLLRAALEMNPAYTHAHFLLGTVLAELGRSEESAFELQRGLNSWPSFPPDPHAPLLEQWKAGYGQRMMNIEMQLAGGDPQGALTKLLEVQKERPLDFMVLNLISRAQQAMGRFDEALATLEKSVETAPDEYTTQVDLVVVLLNLANLPTMAEQRADLLARARQCSEKGVSLAPHIGRTWYYRGLVEYMGLDPSDQQAAQQIVKSAMAAFQRAHLLGCREPQLLETLAQLYAQQGNLREMVKFAEAHTRQAPENPLAWVFLARAQLTAKDYAGARLACARAVEVSRRDPQLLQFQQQLEAAIQQQEQAK